MLQEILKVFPCITLALIMLVYDPAGAQHRPTVPENARTAIKLAQTQRELALRKYQILQMDYEKQSKQLDEEYQNASKTLEELVQAAYKANNVTTADYGLDLEKLEFVPVPKTETSNTPQK